MKEPMIAEMIVSIRDQDRKGHPPPQLAQFRRCGRRPFLYHLGDLEVAALVTIAGFEHRHRTGVSNTGPAATVEPVHDQHMTVSYLQELGIRNSYLRVPRQIKRNFLPGHHVPGVRAFAGELSDGDTPIATQDMRLRTCTTQGTAGLQEPIEILVVGGVALSSS